MSDEPETSLQSLKGRVGDWMGAVRGGVDRMGGNMAGGAEVEGLGVEVDGEAEVEGGRLLDGGDKGRGRWKLWLVWLVWLMWFAVGSG